MGAERTAESRARARDLVYENVRDVIFLVSVEEGDRFRFVEINPAFTAATGLAPAQVIGKRVDEVIPEPSCTLVLSKYREAIRERRTVRWEEVTPFPSGKKYGSVTVTPVFDDAGRCTGLAGTVHDVTAEARARVLASSEQRVLELVASGAPLATSLETLALAVEDQAPPAIASILLLAADGKHVMQGAAPHLPAAFNAAIDGAAIGPRAGSCGTAATLRRSIVVTDIETDPLWDDWRGLARAHGLRACWSTPILSRDGRVLGTFALYYREPRSPTEDELALIARVVHVAGIAIQRHELDEQLRALSARIDAAREDERTGIAREIHDQLGQSLTVLKMDLAWIARRERSADGLPKDDLVAKVKELSDLTDDVIGQVRRISAELRPGVLDDLGLAAAASWQAQEFERRTGVLCHVEVKGEPDRLRREVSTTVFRVLQEALTNVARHASAQRVDVTLGAEGDSLVLVVRDDGTGIRDADVTDPRSLGLVGMRERARRLGGTVAFSRRDPQGTELTFRVPMAAASRGDEPVPAR